MSLGALTEDEMAEVAGHLRKEYAGVFDEVMVQAHLAEHVDTAAIDALATVEGRRDLYTHYDTLRATDPIHRSQHPLFPDCWFVSAHRDVEQILKDRRFIQDARNAEVFAGREGAFADMVSRILIFLPLGGPHERTRSLLYRAFTPQNVARMEPRIRTRVDQILEKLMADG